MNNTTWENKDNIPLSLTEHEVKELRNDLNYEIKTLRKTATILLIVLSVNLIFTVTIINILLN